MAVDTATGEIVEYDADAFSVQSIIDDMNSGRKSIFSTVDTNTEESKDLVFNAITDAEKISDHLKETINLRNFVVQGVTILDKEKEVSVPRLVLIDDQGRGYAGISNPLIDALRNFTEIYGMPGTWLGPRAIVITKEKGKRGDYFKLAKAKVAAK